VEPCPAPAGRPRFDIADIVRQHRTALEADVHLTLAQRRVLSAMALCRTAALGGHVDECRSCGFERPSYNSCRNRHCPKCQALRQEKWIAARTERLLPARHFHVVFTLPSELRALGKCYPRELFGALFSAASETLLDLGDSRLHARLGVTMVLHTWTRDLRFHPHVHALVTAGGLAADGSCWVPSSRKYLFPVQVMGALLRGKMMAALRALNARGAFGTFGDFADPEVFDRLLGKLAKKPWIVYAKKPFREVDHVLKYLGRYTHRVGIANSRLVDVRDNAVTFRTKNGKTATVTPVEFLRRFVQHVLPDGFHKIRHYGLYAGASQDARLAAHDHLAPASHRPASSTEAVAWPTQLRELTGRDVESCPRCGDRLEHRPVMPTLCRAPPHPLAVAA
jgi:hypothetical protein